VSSAFGQTVVGGTALKCENGICPEAVTGANQIPRMEGAGSGRSDQPEPSIMEKAR